jgi:hypothetical protein
MKFPQTTQFHWITYAVIAWSFIYGLLGFYWSKGGKGFPFGENDPRGTMMGSFFTGIKSDEGGIAIAIICLAGVSVALATIRVWKYQYVVSFLKFYTWSMCIMFLIIIPDVRVLQNFAYAFMFQFQLIDWPVLNQTICMVGGLLWGGLAMSYSRRTQLSPSKITKDNFLTMIIHRGQWFTWVAAILALPYGIIRWAWAFGYPLGTPDVLQIANQTIIDRIVEFILGCLPIGGAILILGLIMKWGEVFPSWFFFLAGMKVPIWFAVVPATIATALITLSGLKLIPLLIPMILEGSINSTNWGELGPMLLWLPWGIVLGLSTFSYYHRRIADRR